MCGERSDNVGSSVKLLLMTGGSGTRLWPKSRKSMPKQFMSLGTNQTLFQQTLDRVKSLVPANSIYAVTPPEYLPHIQRQAPNIPLSQTIVEPVQHSTTASLGYAMVWLNHQGLAPDDVIVILPTDAYVGDDKEYLDSLQHAIDIAKSTTGIVTVGIRPTHPATGYGYIQCLPDGRVAQFVEKPSYECAKDYIDAGNYFWNAGMFVWKASTIWQLFQDIRPTDFKTLSSLENLLKYPGTNEQLISTYQKLPKQSFEYTIVEQTHEIYMVPGKFEWTDLGTWSVLLDKLWPETTGKNVVAMDSDGCLVDSGHGLVGLLGVQDLIIVNTEDTVFICRRDRDQDVQQFRELLKERGYGKYL
jgi:mannose-1-phosphate guanylyltransferase